MSFQGPGSATGLTSSGEGEEALLGTACVQAKDKQSLVKLV